MGVPKLRESLSLSELIELPSELRDEAWQAALDLSLAEVELHAIRDRVVTSPTGKELLLAQISPLNPADPVSFYDLAYASTESGVGALIVTDMDDPDSSSLPFRFGVLWSFREYGTLLGNPEDFRTGPNEYDETDTSLLISSPNETLFPLYARIAIHQMMQEHGIENPQMLMFSRPGTPTMFNFVFNAFMEDFESEEAAQSFMDELDWYLPASIGLFPATREHFSEDLFDTFLEVAEAERFPFDATPSDHSEYPVTPIGGTRIKSSVADTTELSRLLAVPMEQRTDLWDEQLLTTLPDAEVLILDELQYSDGFPFCVLYDISKIEELQANDISFQEVAFREASTWALSHGCGIALNPEGNRVQWKFRAGDLECFHTFGIFYRSQIKMERSYDYLDSDAEEAVADVDEFDDTEPVDYSDSSKLTQIEAGEGFTVFDIFDFLSPLTQIRIGFILEHYTDIEPRGAIIERDSNKKLSAVFNLYMEDFEDQEQAEEYLHVMQWYIPNHISVLLVPRSMDIELKPLVQNSDCEGEG